jgi:hypothetical protein
MKDKSAKIQLPNRTGHITETIWQTLAGCAVFWAGFLALYWML